MIGGGRSLWQGFATWDEISRCPMTNQPNEAGNWAANNPAYELFFIQAEVHHRQRHSPSPDNTEAQVPDMPSEIAMDGDNDSLANVRPNILTLLKSLT